MSDNSIRTVITLDFTKKAWEQSNYNLHNRWHPDIPAVAVVKPGETFKVESYDSLGGQLENNDSIDDVQALDLSGVHYLSGPISVEGAEPGDYLEVDILDIQPIQGHEWGVSALLGASVGGFLSDVIPNLAKAIWEFEGEYATSRHIPGVKFPGLIHPGVIGTAPSMALIQQWNQREFILVSTDPNKTPPLALLPEDKSSLMGALEATPEVARAKAREAVRTIPPRENGGNADIKNLSKGSKLWLPVHIPGANLSLGDFHFSQGDGEIGFCGGIEMKGVITLKINVIKNGVGLHGNLTMPMFMPGPVEPRFSRYLAFQGISVDDNGKQHYLNSTLSFRQACLNAIAYFKRFGYSSEQLCMLLSCIPMEGRLSAVVDIPNVVSTASVPVNIFDFDIMPKEGGHLQVIKGNCPISKTDYSMCSMS